MPTLLDMYEVQTEMCSLVSTLFENYVWKKKFNFKPD